MTENTAAKIPQVCADPLILVAEDEVLIQKIVAAKLARMGFSVTATANGQECLSELRTGRPPVLLLLDLAMPIMGGIEVLEALQHDMQFKDLPIVIFSATNESQTIRKAIKLGAWDYILKPFDIDEFGMRVSELVFETDTETLQKLLSNLRMKDGVPFHALGFTPGKARPMEAYSTIFGDMPLCILVPERTSPQALAKLAMNDLKSKILIFRKCAAGWRKVWPRFDDLTVLR